MEIVLTDDCLGLASTHEAKGVMGLGQRLLTKAVDQGHGDGSGTASNAISTNGKGMVKQRVDPMMLPSDVGTLVSSLENSKDAIRFLSTRTPGWNSADGARSGSDEDTVNSGVSAASTSPRWIPLATWIGAAVLSRRVEPFTGHGTASGASLLDDMLASPGRFKNWLESDEPELVALPLDWRELESKPVHKACAVVALRPDRGQAALSFLAQRVLPQNLNPNRAPRVGRSTFIT